MNLDKPVSAALSLFHSLFLKSRFLMPSQHCRTFFSSRQDGRNGIGQTYVINLDRAPERWSRVTRELKHVLDASGREIAEQTIRHSAVDANHLAHDTFPKGDVRPFYTLGDQLYVEPQPNVLPDCFDLDQPIQMSPPEIAIARSHIDVWKRIAQGEHSYALVLEDDVWFGRGFGRLVDQAWLEMEAMDRGEPNFDLFYLSYKEVKHGARKRFLSRNVFRPERGLWFFSGYVLSKRGATKLLDLLPCCGPIDLWINHRFQDIDVRAVRRSVIDQRLDSSSSNSYSILPSLTKIGVIDSENAALFQQRPKEQPVFAFGEAGSGMSSLAMALSMLGYRCCSDLDELPKCELENLLSGNKKRVFNAYVNIGSLVQHVDALRKRYRQAKFIVTERSSKELAGDFQSLPDYLAGADVAVLRPCDTDKWKVICEHLRCAPPVCPYPESADTGQRELLREYQIFEFACNTKHLESDKSPWIVERGLVWTGISSSRMDPMTRSPGSRVTFVDSLQAIDAERWMLRDDTFPGNLGLFRPTNVRLHHGSGVDLTVIEEPLGVRSFSAAAVSSRQSFLFGRFEATLQATRVPGLVTGFFLHRDSPRQEIDIEIAGNRSERLLVNVFWNPGAEGAKFDYGYRGSPSSIALGFDAAESAHVFAIEWDPCEIRWFVDGRLVHRRTNWDPTPIPHLPMTLHVNTWPSRSRELAGRLASYALPAAAILKFISVDAVAADKRNGVDWRNANYPEAPRPVFLA